MLTLLIVLNSFVVYAYSILTNLFPTFIRYALKQVVFSWYHLVNPSMPQPCPFPFFWETLNNRWQNYDYNRFIRDLISRVYNAYHLYDKSESVTILFYNNNVKIVRIISIPNFNSKWLLLDISFSPRVYQQTPNKHEIRNTIDGATIILEKNNFPDTGTVYI